MSFDVPSSILTDRLELRAPRVEDAAAVNEAILETFDQLHRWLPWALHPPSLEETIEVCTRMAEKWSERKDFPLFGFERASGRFVLGAGLHRWDFAVPSFEIGYWCRKTAQGKGYVKEAVLAITKMGFEVVHANRIEIRCDAENNASAAVARACGFELEGALVNHRRNVHGNLNNTLIFAQVRNDV
ncbi:MAG: GNAT family N-acetyltransferase [Fimbriimonas sp.]